MFAENVLSAIRITAEEYSLRVASLIPTTMSELDRIAKKSNGKKPALSRALAQEMTTTKRSIEWIQENGRCLDNIVPGPSTLSQAGRGAIAQRFIASGDVVVPVPLLQIIDRESLVVHGAKKDEEGYGHGHGHGTQLLLNYCFGHNESSLLLCPLTNAMMINHCSNRTKTCREDGPNAMFRWDTTWDMKTGHWLELTLEEMAEEFGRGLSFEVIATRDILPEDEVSESDKSLLRCHLSFCRFSHSLSDIYRLWKLLGGCLGAASCRLETTHGGTLSFSCKIE
jgi:hypothetical protein